MVATGLTRVDGASTCSPAEASPVEATRPHELVAYPVYHRVGPGPANRQGPDQWLSYFSIGAPTMLPYSVQEPS